MADEQKPLSEKLRALRDEFNDLATRAKNTVAHLDSAIAEAKSAEIRADLDRVLDQFIPTVDKSALKGHDIVFLVNKSQDMGEGIFSPIGAALTTASSLSAATGGHDAKVSALTWEGAGSTRGVNLSDFSRIEKAYEKSRDNAQNLLPAVKEIMIGNTPDKQDDRQKHYIIVSPGKLSDDLDHSAQMIATAMQMNPRITFDFISFGAGNVDELISKVGAPEDRKPAHQFVAKHEDLKGAVMSILSSRFKGETPQSISAPAPVAEAPKTETAVEQPEVENAAPEAPKAEPPAAVVETPAAAATPEAKKRWYKFHR